MRYGEIFSGPLDVIQQVLSIFRCRLVEKCRSDISDTVSPAKQLADRTLM
jgi:hypothetical protein